MEALYLSAAHIKQPRSRESQILIIKIQENITNFIAKYTRQKIVNRGDFKTNPSKDGGLQNRDCLRFVANVSSWFSLDGRSLNKTTDTACPWCFVGLRRLQAAISQFQSSELGRSGNHTFNITWKAFYLDPTRPTVNKRAYQLAKFGEERMLAMHERLTSVGREVGINFSFGGNSGNTRDSHRLIQLGAQKGVQTEVVERLFAAYMENEQDITDHEVLVTAAKEAGIKEEEAREWLSSDKGGMEADMEAERARRRGISGVPNFTINGVHRLGGAQDSEAFVEIFEEIARS
jgi:predicted DsbA family dithiol-disulfide isomerase